MNQQPIRDALKQIAGYGVRNLLIGILFFSVVLNIVISTTAGFVSASGEAWKPMVAAPITAIVLFVVGIVAAIKFAIGSTLHHGIVKADVVRVTVNAIFDRFGVDPNLGLTRTEFNRRLGEAVNGLRAQPATGGKMSWVTEKVRNKILNLSESGISRYADSAFQQSEKISLQTFRDSAADRINSRISTAIRGGTAIQCSALLIVAAAAMLGLAFAIRLV